MSTSGGCAAPAVCTRPAPRPPASDQKKFMRIQESVFALTTALLCLSLAACSERPAPVAAVEATRPAPILTVGRRTADEALRLSPTALKVLKHSFNAETEHIAGVGQMAFDSLDLFLGSPEAQEGVTSINEKRPPDFGRYR